MKWGLGAGLAGVVALVLLGGPWLAGRQLEARLNAWSAQAFADSENLYVALYRPALNLKVARGWFHSQIEGSFSYVLPINQRPGIPEDEARVTLPVAMRAQHGPVFWSPRPGLGLARIAHAPIALADHLDVSAQDKPLLAPLRLEGMTTLGFGGAIASRWKSAAAEIALSDAAVSWKGFQARLDWPLDMSRVRAAFAVPGLEVRSEDKHWIRLDALTGDMDLTAAGPHLWLGDAALSLASLSARLKDDKEFSLEGLALSGDARLMGDGATFASRFRYALAALRLGEARFSDIILAGSAEGIDKAAYEDYLGLIAAAAKPSFSGDRAIDSRALMESYGKAFGEVGRRFLAAGPHLVIDPFGLSTPQGRSEAKLAIGIRYDGPVDEERLPAIARAIDAEATVDMTQVHAMALARIAAERKLRRQGEALAPVEIDAAANALLNELRDKDLIQPGNGRYLSQWSLREGVLKVNGQTRADLMRIQP